MKVAKQPLFCPACGASDVWTDEDDSGDYYQGTAYYCLTCHACLPDLGSVGIESAKLERADAYSLADYLAIRMAAHRDDVETKRVRELYAKAADEQSKRIRDSEAERARRRPVPAAEHWIEEERKVKS